MAPVRVRAPMAKENLMDRMRLRLTYANVMSTVAVFIALGGSAYAVGALPADSVGTKQLAKAAVTGAKIAPHAVTAAKVKKGSLVKADFGRGQLPAGARGPQGLQGPQGLAGVAGAKG